MLWGGYCPIVDITRPACSDPLEHIATNDECGPLLISTTSNQFQPLVGCEISSNCNVNYIHSSLIYDLGEMGLKFGYCFQFRVNRVNLMNENYIRQK